MIRSSRCDYTKSYPQITDDWIANTPKMAANVGNKFKLENFRPTVTNKSELEDLFIFFPNRYTCLVLFSSEVFTWQSKNMEKSSPNRVQLFLRNKYTVFTIGGTVALRSDSKKIFGELQFCSYKILQVDIDCESSGYSILSWSTHTIYYTV